MSNCCCFNAHAVYTTRPCTSLQCRFIWSHVYGNMGVKHTKIRASPESWPWRKKFSYSSCGDSNQQQSHIRRSDHWAVPAPYALCSNCNFSAVCSQALPYVCLLILMLFFIYAIIGMQVGIVYHLPPKWKRRNCSSLTICWPCQFVVLKRFEVACVWLVYSTGILRNELIITWIHQRSAYFSFIPSTCMHARTHTHTHAHTHTIWGPCTNRGHSGHCPWVTRKRTPLCVYSLW